VPSDDLVIRIAGEGGEGVISCGEILSKAVVRGGLNIHAFRTFPAEIRGGLAMFQLRASSSPTLSLKQSVDILMAFNQQAYNAYVTNIKPEGALVYDPKLCTPDDRLGGSKRFELPLEDLTVESTGGKRAKNMAALGALLYFYDIPIEFGKEQVKEFFGRKGEEVVAVNQKALQTGFDHSASRLGELQHSFERHPERDQITLTGNQAVALGAIAAGVEYVGGYPITPATPIFEFLCKELPRFGGVAIQMEDEIASLASVIGASFAGKRSFTATSGPGLSLMSETLNLAAMAETPLVICNVMRGGPSTGLPTKTEQSDLKFAIYGTSGESPRCIMAPLSISDCFWQTMRAFRIAERYQMPVILLTDQAMAYSSQNIDMPDLKRIERFRRLRPESGVDPQTFKRYQITETGVSPMPIPGEDDLPYMGTGLEHDERGAPNYTPANHIAMTAKRFQKLRTLGVHITQQPVEEVEPEGAEVGIVGWGSTYGAISEALQMLIEYDGVRVAHLHPRVLAPLNEWRIRRFLGPLRKIICAEENFTGQYAHFMKGKFGIRPVEVHKIDGIPFTAEEIYQAIKEEL
jgi:2-oxoglutarate ferredoxin oxidoreductase subunit alpha